MSVLIYGLPDTLTVKVIQRLVDEDDEVRLLVTARAHVERWKSLGAHVAVGDPGDADLIERACSGTRTIVLGDDLDEEALAETLRGAAAADVSRVVLVAPQPKPRSVEMLGSSGLEFVVLTTARKSLIARPRSRVPLSKLAEVIDAADDLEGRLQIELDLTNPQSWRILKVLPPEEKY